MIIRSVGQHNTRSHLMLSDSLICMSSSSTKESMRLQLLACCQVCMRYIEAPACLAVNRLHFSSSCHAVMATLRHHKGRGQVDVAPANQGVSVPNRSKDQFKKNHNFSSFSC